MNEHFGTVPKCSQNWSIRTVPNDQEKGEFMRTIKLFISLFLFTTILLLSAKANAAGSISLTASKNSLKVGEEFTVSVNLSGAEVATLTTRVSIDTSKIQYVSGPANSNYVNRKSNICMD